MPLNVVVIFFEIVVLILAFSVHECAHAWTASRLGDPTARMLGRVTLNPLKHLDPLGSIVFPLISLVYGGFLIGWAKPTPVTGRNFKNYRRDDILVTLAGPASNLLSATIALILLIVIKHILPAGDASIATAMAIAMHIPGVATEGLPALFPIALFLYLVIFINLLLFVFNLIPLPRSTAATSFATSSPTRPPNSTTAWACSPSSSSSSSAADSSRHSSIPSTTSSTTSSSPSS